jgi:hypothetical protein
MLAFYRQLFIGLARDVWLLSVQLDPEERLRAIRAFFFFRLVWN